MHTTKIIKLLLFKSVLAQFFEIMLTSCFLEIKNKISKLILRLLNN